MAARRSPKVISEERARLTAYAIERDIELLFLDPPETFDAAIVGVVYGFNQDPAVLYDEALVLAALQQSGMSFDEAEEYFEFNTIGAWLGPATPRFLICPASPGGD
jgi:hypothetical protein